MKLHAVVRMSLQMLAGRKWSRGGWRGLCVGWGGVGGGGGRGAVGAVKVPATRRNARVHSCVTDPLF